MLLPSQLKAPQMAFIEETDIDDEVQLRASCQEMPKAPLTGYQKDRLSKRAHEEKQAEQDKVGPDERERTIRCLLKVMKYQLDGVEDNFKNMEGALKQNDRELARYQRELEE